MQIKHQVAALRVPLSSLPQLLMGMQVKPPSTDQGHCGGHPAGGNLLIAVTAKGEQEVPLLAEDVGRGMDSV